MVTVGDKHNLDITIDISTNMISLSPSPRKFEEVCTNLSSVTFW